MKTIVYISRHSKPLKDLVETYDAKESEQIRNEKNPLSVEGEDRALKMSMYEDLQDIDVIYSSHYVRTMSTAKYIALNNHIKLNVDERFGERKFGLDGATTLPDNYFEDQFRNWDYKLPLGESLNEVADRMKSGFDDLLKANAGKKVMLVSHGTALSAMFSKWCTVKLNEATKLVEIYFKDRLVFDGNWDAPELFKLEFEDTELIDIKNIKWH